MFKITCLCCLLVIASSLLAQPVTITNLQCEYRTNPLGIDAEHPRFSWNIQTIKRNAKQTAYRVLVSDNLQDIQRNKGNTWDSDKQPSSRSIMISYAGRNLLPAKKYYWKTQVWLNNNGAPSWSAVNNFTTGLFHQTDWSQAKWIGYEELADSLQVIPGVHGNGNNLKNKAVERPVTPLFRKEFAVTKKVVKALMFISGLGQYELHMNGKKISDDFLTPGWTYYDKTCLYNTYDITASLSGGKNVIGVIVGNGFYNINRERYRKLVIAFGMPKMICQLKITFTDGTVQTLVTDDTWKTAPSAITFNSIYGGEDYDATLELRGWDKPTFSDAGWKKVLLVNPPKGILVADNNYPIKVNKVFQPVKITQPQPGIYMYDYGQNASGIVELKVTGKKGQVVKLTPAELVTNKKLANQNATGNPYYYSYTLKGDGVETWRPRFTYYGFRYVQVEGAVPDSAQATGAARIINLAELHTGNSAPHAGSFVCSNELFNKIFTLINWAIKSNFQSVLTDCPHREKLSWLEEDHLMGGSIHYNFDIFALYRKLVYDMMDAQTPDGLVPDIAPEFVPFQGGFRDSPEWGSSAIILPWMLYTWYGDSDIMIHAYPMMKKYLDYLEKKSDNHILSYGLGDWFDYGPGRPGEAQLTPKALTATAIYFYDIMLLQKMAGIIGDREESSRLVELASAVKKSFNEKFYNKKTNVYSTGSQTAMSMPLYVGLVDEQDRAAVIKQMVDSINASGKKLTAGDVGFHYLIKALDEGGASQLIFDMNYRDDVPGYGYQLKKGATALTESWPALEEVSNNHLMLGHIMEWFYSGLLGITEADDAVAYNHIVIRPQPVGNITSAKGYFISPYK
jgi:alpha-L-rhamnosidase